MTNIQEFFNQFQHTINHESVIKKRLGEIEQDFNTSLSSVKGGYFDLSFKTPVKLSREDYVSDTNEAFLSFEGSELSQLSKDHQEISPKGVDNLQLLSTLYGTYSSTLDEVDCNPLLSDRLNSHMNEEILFLLLLNRYYKVAAFHFNELNIMKESVTVPLVSESPSGILGLIVTPEEAQRVLGIRSLNYATYLVCLLRLVDQIVDYTREIIIQISINSKKLTENELKQYSVSVMNLKAISKIQNGFLMLELKNDFVRRKYDGLKYNLKKMNSIVYDLTLRNLISFNIEVI